MKDSLGDRMKQFYENRTRQYLPRRGYTVIRVDGKAFHTYTRGLTRPFDDGLMEDMDATAQYLCRNIMGAKFAFVQSDEISILLTDFENNKTEAWFDNNVQKMCSVSASMTTAAFNKARLMRLGLDINFAEFDSRVFNVLAPIGERLSEIIKFAEFDSRIFQVPNVSETQNYFIWRQQDATRNSISSVAQSLYSPKELHGKSSDLQQEMIFQKGQNWNDLAARYKRGRIILKEEYQITEPALATRTRWATFEVPVFTQDKDFLNQLIPDNF